MSVSRNIHAGSHGGVTGGGYGGDMKIDTIIRERDEAELKLRRVVGYCIESRKEPRELQAAWLRDAILTDIDPLMNITQQLREEGTNESP